MAKLSKSFNAGNVFMILLVAVMGIFLWGEFTDTTVDPDTGEDQLTFTTPDDLDGTVLWIIRLLIIGGAVYLGYTLVIAKLSSGRMSRKDLMSLIMIGIAVYFLWEYVISKIMDADSLADISFKTAKKLGMG